MFKKAFSGDNSKNNSGSSSSAPSPSYAFSSPSAALSSSTERRKETENFYKPLPNPNPNDTAAGAGAARPGSGVPAAAAGGSSTPRDSRNYNSNNPFNDPIPGTPPLNNTGINTGGIRSFPSTPGQFDSTSSPNVSRPLLSGVGGTPRTPGAFQSASPSDPGARFRDSTGDMPTPQRYGGGGSSRLSSSGMPPRGESQSALLGGNGNGDRQVPNARRYGPTASSAPVGPNAALLGSPAQSISDTRPLQSQDTAPWTQGIDANPEADDYLHNPDPKMGMKHDRGSIFTTRGVVNIGCLGLLLLGILTLFAGYPIITFYTLDSLGTDGAYNLGGINSSGQVPSISNFPSVIDPDTPSSAMSHTGFDGKTYNLVFSDEFNKDGRTFYEGDDPYWTAVDLHYWPTGDFEWYDPSAITTRDGNLVITQTQEPIHDLNFKSGMLQSWNQMCFSYSTYIEVRVSLPGKPSVGGFWPGVWMMGNLGRPGYGATTEGTWPYTYDSCDVGTLKNQTNKEGTGPPAALTTGNNADGISYLPGQRLSACTCAGEDHPGPTTDTGRGVPEIDIIEAQTNLDIPRGQVSQSAQVAPFDDHYQFGNTSSDLTQYDTDLTIFNSYKGGPFQEAVSSLTYIPTENYQLTSKGFGVYGFEYYGKPDKRDEGYITWTSTGVKSWKMLASSVGPNEKMQIGQRLVSEEPMAMVINFGMSNNFQTVNFNDLQWPAEMLVDYVRVYQTDEGEMGCDPSHHPTSNYIEAHKNAYTNPNFTTWDQAGYTFPKNRLIDNC